MSRLSSALRKLRIAPKKGFSYESDGLAVTRKNLGFMTDPDLMRGWEKAVEGNRKAWGGNPPDIRWRAHTALWAARHGMTIEGDFVECGVFLGLLSLTICHGLDFAKSGRHFHLFDTFNGIPDDGDPKTALRNKNFYNFDAFDQATENFAPFPNVKLIRGILPDTLDQLPSEKIAYLSVDLNRAPAEIASIEVLWDRLTPSAMVVLDDYAFKGHDAQYHGWNAFAESKGKSILTLPTGQGLLIK